MSVSVRYSNNVSFWSLFSKAIEAEEMRFAMGCLTFIESCSDIDRRIIMEILCGASSLQFGCTWGIRRSNLQHKIALATGSWMCIQFCIKMISSIY